MRSCSGRPEAEEVKRQAELRYKADEAERSHKLKEQRLAAEAEQRRKEEEERQAAEAELKRQAEADRLKDIQFREMNARELVQHQQRAAAWTLEDQRAKELAAKKIIEDSQAKIEELLRANPAQPTSALPGPKAALPAAPEPPAQPETNQEQITQLQKVYPVIDRANKEKRESNNQSALPVIRAIRVALVIGNSDYSHAPRLTNPVNDANLISNTLRSTGFDVVTLLDASQAVMKKAMGEFEDVSTVTRLQVCFIILATVFKLKAKTISSQ